MQVAIVGSRDFCTICARQRNRLIATSKAARLHEMYGCSLDLVGDWIKSHLKTGRDLLVSGGAAGVDAAAERVAARLGFDIEVFPADWETHGNKAGLLRNTEIVAHAEMVVAFWDGSSRGTMDTVRKARDAGTPVNIYIRPQIIPKEAWS